MILVQIECTIRVKINEHFELQTVILMVENCPKNQILSENLSWASIYPSQVIEVYLYVKNSYFLIFIKLVHFLAISPYELQENLTFNDQYYLFWPILL